MTDITTKKLMRVSTDGTAGPYIMVPEQQLDQVSKLLKSHSVRHWVEENVISIGGKPAIGVINLGRGGDAKKVQDILDAADSRTP
jgi:hypothetical protein